MTPAQLLREAAQNMQREGYCHNYGTEEGPGCGCFASHLDRAALRHRVFGQDAYYDAHMLLHGLLGPSPYPNRGPFSEVKLAEEGWTKEDAVALLEMAADLAS